MRLPAKFPLRRILRRFDSATGDFPEKDAFVRDPTRGATSQGAAQARIDPHRAAALEG